MIEQEWPDCQAQASQEQTKSDFRKLIQSKPLILGSSLEDL